MRQAKSLQIVVSLSLATAACGKTEKTEMPAVAPTVDTEGPNGLEGPVPVDEDRELTREDVGNDTLVMLTKLVEISETHKGDCQTTAAAFRETFAAYRATLDAGKKMEEVPEDQQWFEENYSYKFNTQAMRMRENLGDCLSDPEFQKVMAEMN